MRSYKADRVRRSTRLDHTSDHESGVKLQKGNAESAHTGKVKRELVSGITGFCSVHFIAKINVNNFQHAQGAETAEL